MEQQQQFAMEPQDQVAVVGARVILPCRVLYKKGALQWTKDDFGLGKYDWIWVCWLFINMRSGLELQEHVVVCPLLSVIRWLEVTTKETIH